MPRNLSQWRATAGAVIYRGIPAAARHMLPLFRSLPLLLIGWPRQNIARLLTARKGTPHDRTTSAQRQLVDTKSDSFGDIDLSAYIMHIQKCFGDFHGGTSLPLGRSAYPSRAYPGIPGTRPLARHPRGWRTSARIRSQIRSAIWR